MSIYPPVTADEEEVRRVYHILSKVLRLLRLTRYGESYFDGLFIVGKWKKAQKQLKISNGEINH